MVKNVKLGSLFEYIQVELESVSEAVRAENNLNKVHFFLEKDMLLILRTASLIHLYGFYVYASFTKYKECN